MTKSYNFDQVINRRSTDSLKWRIYAEDVLPMWVAEMDFPAPEPVLNALRAVIDLGILGYPTCVRDLPDDQSEFRQLLVERMARLYHWEIEPEAIIFLPGVVTGFNLACHALGSPDCAVLIQTPVYPPILAAAAETGIARQEMELDRNPDGTYTIDWDRFQASISPQTALFILCNPHNPVGKVFQQDELAHIAEICLRNQVTIVSDEIHCDLVYTDQQHIPIAALDPEIAHSTITLMAPSKTYNIAGLQCSFAIIPNRNLRKRLLEARQGLVPWVNLMGIAAGQAAYQAGQEWLDQVLAYLQANRDFLYQYVEQNLPGIQMAKPAGTYLAWLDCRAAGIAPKYESPYEFFLKEARIGFNDGGKFGRGGEGFIRLNFGCPRPLLVECLERMRRVL